MGPHEQVVQRGIGAGLVRQLRLDFPLIERLRRLADGCPEYTQIGLYFTGPHQMDAGEQHAEGVEQRLQLTTLLEEVG
jgi:hypothetical protein